MVDPGLCLTCSFPHHVAWYISCGRKLETGHFILLWPWYSLLTRGPGQLVPVVLYRAWPGCGKSQNMFLTPSLSNFSKMCLIQKVAGVRKPPGRSSQQHSPVAPSGAHLHARTSPVASGDFRVRRHNISFRHAVHDHSCRAVGAGRHSEKAASCVRGSAPLCRAWDRTQSRTGS